jgi:DnaJ-class molecular chaperone
LEVSRSFRHVPPQTWRIGVAKTFFLSAVFFHFDQSKMMTTKDYYQTLGLDADASAERIKEAYRKLAFQYHPDRNDKDPEAAENMKRINEAYAVLANPAKRREYDLLRRRFGSSAGDRFRNTYSDQDIFSGSDIHTVFEEMARAFGLRGFEDIFREFYGKNHSHFEFHRPGYSARGFFFSGPLRPGTARHHQRRVPGWLGKLPIYLLRKFTGLELPQNGGNIEDSLVLDPLQARQGGPYAYYHRQRSKKLVVQLPPDVRHGQRIRLTGMGQPGRNGGRDGDLYLKIRLRKPWLQTLKDSARKLIGERN